MAPQMHRENGSKIASTKELTAKYFVIARKSRAQVFRKGSCYCSGLLAIVICTLSWRAAWSADKVHLASRPTTLSESKPISLQLLSALDNSHSGVGLSKWRDTLAHARTKDDRPFDMNARDHLFEHIRIAVNAIPQNSSAELLIVESIYQNHDNTPEYDRVQVLLRGRKEIKEFSKLTELGVKSISEEECRGIELPLKLLMKAGGSNNGVQRPTHLLDATVISYFDGQRWKIETWYWLTALDFAIDLPSDRGGLPESPRALIDLIDAVKPYSWRARGFGPKIYESMSEQFPHKRELEK